MGLKFKNGLKTVIKKINKCNKIPSSKHNIFAQIFLASGPSHWETFSMCTYPPLPLEGRVSSSAPGWLRWTPSHPSSPEHYLRRWERERAPNIHTFSSSQIQYMLYLQYKYRSNIYWICNKVNIYAVVQVEGDGWRPAEGSTQAQPRPGGQKEGDRVWKGMCNTASCRVNQKQAKKRDPVYCSLYFSLCHIVLI